MTPIPPRTGIPQDDYRLERVGRCEEGRHLMAFVTAPLPAAVGKADGPRFKRWHSELHLFDAGGRHRQADAT